MIEEKIVKTIKYNNKKVIDIYGTKIKKKWLHKKKWYIVEDFRVVHWENMPFKNCKQNINLVKHKEYGICQVIKIMQCGKNEGELELDVLKNCIRHQISNNGGTYHFRGMTVRADVNEVEEIKFKDDKSKKKFYNDSFAESYVRAA